MSSKKSKTDQAIVSKLVHEIHMIHHDEESTEIPMQYLLVKYGGRKAFLLETSEYSPETVQKFLALAKEIGLNVTKDRLGLESSPRYLIHAGKLKTIPRNDEDLGALLGFKDPGGDFGDWRHSRTTLDISPTAETCGFGCVGASTTELVKGNRQEIEAFADMKVRSFNNVMTKLGLPYRFDYGIQEKHGSLRRSEELKRMNMKYIRTNKHLYINDLWNQLNGDENHPFLLLFETVIKNKETLKRYLPFYLYFYRLINDDKVMYDTKTIIKRLNKKFLELLSTFE